MRNGLYYLEEEDVLFFNYLPGHFKIILPTKTLTEKYPRFIGQVDKRYKHTQVNIVLGVSSIKKTISRITILSIIDWAFSNNKFNYVNGVSEYELKIYYGEVR